MCPVGVGSAVADQISFDSYPVVGANFAVQGAIAVDAISTGIFHTASFDSDSDNTRPFNIADKAE